VKAIAPPPAGSAVGASGSRIAGTVSMIAYSRSVAPAARWSAPHRLASSARAPATMKV
jgi:hypothetical protein